MYKFPNISKHHSTRIYYHKWVLYCVVLFFFCPLICADYTYLSFVSFFPFDAQKFASIFINDFRLSAHQDLCWGFICTCVNVCDNRVPLQILQANSLSFNFSLMLSLTLLFTDSFQPISFFLHIVWHCYFSASTDISEYRTHDTSHASISHINIIFPIHYTVCCARIRRK